MSKNKKLIQSKDYTIEVFTDKPLDKESNLFELDNSRYVHQGSYSECRDITKNLNENGYKVKMYKTSWGRNNDYRKAYFKHNKPPYRCAYCGRKLAYDQVTVDHVVPVSLSKNSLTARLVMAIAGYKDVNDERNLVAACRPCNKRKGKVLSLSYLIKAKLGKHKWYWKAVWACRIAVITSLIYVAIRLIMH